MRMLPFISFITSYFVFITLLLDVIRTADIFSAAFPMIIHITMAFLEADCVVKVLKQLLWDRQLNSIHSMLHACMPG